MRLRRTEIKTRKLLLRKEWFEDVEGKGERLDGRCARPHDHTPAQNVHPPAQKGDCDRNDKEHSLDPQADKSPKWAKSDVDVGVVGT